MTTAIIVAAGKSERMGAGTDKAFLSLGNKPVVAWSLIAFERCPEVDRIVLVVRKDQQIAAKAVVRMFGISKLQAFPLTVILITLDVWQGSATEIFDLLIITAALLSEDISPKPFTVIFPGAKNIAKAILLPDSFITWPQEKYSASKVGCSFAGETT